jgi:propionyl-CoA synthetase
MSCRDAVYARSIEDPEVAGHRLSTGAMEEVLASHPDIAERAVIGVADSIKGEIPVGLVVLKSGVSRDPAVIADELIRIIRDRVGPVASFKRSPS